MKGLLSLGASILLAAGIVAAIVFGMIRLGTRAERPQCPRCGDPVGPDQVRGDICHSCLAKWPWPS